MKGTETLKVNSNDTTLTGLIVPLLIGVVKDAMFLLKTAIYILLLLC